MIYTEAHLREFQECERRCGQLERERDMLTEALARVMAENEHLRRALWLAQHPEHQQAKEGSE